MRKKKQSGQPVKYTREQLVRGAYVMGENSGLAKVLAEYDRRMAAGIPTEAYQFAGTLIVGDPIRDLVA